MLFLDSIKKGSLETIALTASAGKLLLGSATTGIAALTAISGYHYFNVDRFAVRTEQQQALMQQFPLLAFCTAFGAALTYASHRVSQAAWRALRRSE